VDENETLAYLAGLLDGDGYLKIVKSSLKGGRWVYYQIQVGIQQLWPGEAVRLFARTFTGKMMKPMIRAGLRPMARCELHTRKAEAALQQLQPYLLVKRPQAFLLQEFCRLKKEPKPISRRSGSPRRAFSPDQVAAMERLRSRLIALHEGSYHDSESASESVESQAQGVRHWTRRETMSYLAGIIDSDGNLRIERRNAKRMLAPQYRINIRAGQVSPSAAVELLAETFGGHVTTNRPNRPAHRGLDIWSLHDKQAADAVSALLPYMVVKKREGELLLELRRQKAQGKQGLTEWVHRNRWQRPIRMRKRCYTPEQVAEFERIRKQVNSLHSGAAAKVASEAPV